MSLYFIGRRTDHGGGTPFFPPHIMKNKKCISYLMKYTFNILTFGECDIVQKRIALKYVVSQVIN